VFRPAKDSLLLLEDGSIFYGRSFGSEADSIGEVVFNTGMVGYLESMTDPSYAGQILAFTYPLIGNYGVPPYSDRDEFGLPRFFESDSIKVKGIVVQEACGEPSHWASKRTLSKWMESEGIPGIEGVDTRALVTKLRESGVMLGMMAVGGEGRKKDELAELLARAQSYASQNFVKGVTVAKPVIHGSSDERVVLLDCGTKYGIVRNLLGRGFQVVRLPYNASYSAVMKYDPAGVVVCNGPGDPKMLMDTSKCVGSLVDSDVPVLGICLGEQVVGMSQGAETFKLKYGHRGQNKPCIDLTTGRGYVTSQNHGYALAEKSLKGTDLSPWFVNADDKTVEGVRHAKKPCMAVQFHPEATPGPFDTLFVFDRFVDAIRGKSPRREVIRSVKM
jgi:carbamoyl-phosphate synthase small subunit